MRRTNLFLLFVGLTFLILGICHPARAVEITSPDFIRVGYQYGHILHSNDFVRKGGPSGQSIDMYQAGRLEVGWQTTGRELWEQAYNLPSYGFGLQGIGFHDYGELGHPVAAYGFFVYPIKRWDRWIWNTQWGLGLAGPWNSFDEVSNPNNIAIGSHVTALIDLGSTVDFALTRKLDLGLGVSFTHYSDGGVQQPNIGLNTLTPMVDLTYHFQDQVTLPERHVPAYTSRWEMEALGWGGWVNLGPTHADTPPQHRFPTHDFPAAGITAMMNRQLSWMSKIGAGIDLTYDDSHTEQVNVDGSVHDLAPSFWDKSSVGLIVGYEQVINRFSVILQLGQDVLRKEIPGQTPNFYQRLGVKYLITENIFLGLNCRFHNYNKSQRLEFAIGRRWML